MHKLLTILACIAITACSSPDYAYVADCTNGTTTEQFDVDGSDYEGNQFTRTQAVQMLQDALNDQESTANWTCK